MTAAALTLTRISKQFGPVAALWEVDFSLQAGEVHALLGENGAGKSTLLHVAYGLVHPDAGAIAVRGRVAVLRSPRDARTLSIGMVHQHFTSIPELTVAENLALAMGRKAARASGFGTRYSVLGARHPALASLTASLLQGLEPAVRVRELGVAQRQRLEIVKALATGAGILLLDEPSAVLTPDEVDALLGEIRAFARRGGAVAFVTHKLGEVFAVADRVTVLRQGAVTLRGVLRDQTEAALAEAMIGTALAPPPPPSAGRGAPSTGPGAALVTVGSVVIGSGELVGVAAIEGQGQRQLLRRIAAVPDPSGPERAPRSELPVSVSGTVAFIPEDRTTEGLIPEMSIAENLVLGRETDARWSRGGWIQWRAVRQYAGRLMELLWIRAPGPNSLAGYLSGGNQQKLMLGRALERAPPILVVENPTRGLDIRATADVQQRLRQAANDGVAVLVYSPDLDEVLSLADRVLVVREGKVTEAPAGADRHAIGRMMLGMEGER